jgi:hypothetical protein
VKKNSAIRRRPGMGMIAIGLGIILSAGATWRASSAVFTATTANGADTFATGNVALVDNDSAAAMFTVSGMKPGSTGQSCITVTYNGSLAAGVRLYGTSPSATNSLDGQINLQVEESTASSTFGASCTGFTSPTTLYNGAMSTFGTTYTQYSNGLSTWAPSGSGQVHSYRFTYTLSSSAPNSVMSSTASITFTWEANNT